MSSSSHQKETGRKTNNRSQSQSNQSGRGRGEGRRGRGQGQGRGRGRGDRGGRSEGQNRGSATPARAGAEESKDDVGLREKKLTLKIKEEERKKAEAEAEARKAEAEAEARKAEAEAEARKAEAEAEARKAEAEARIAEARIAEAEARKAEAEAKSNNTLSEDMKEVKKGLNQILLSQSDPWSKISESHWSKNDSAEARKDSVCYYGLQGKNQCQVLGNQKNANVTNAHIWPRHASTSLHLFGLSQGDIDGPRNVLRLCKDIERAFDKKQITFVYGPPVSGMEEDLYDNQRLVVKVLCPDLRRKQVTGTQETFDDIENKPLLTPKDHNPYRRLLAHHAVKAMQHARERGWIPRDTIQPEEDKATQLMNFSLDKEAQDRIKLMWKNVE